MLLLKGRRIRCSIFTTFGITKHGIVKYTSPEFDADFYKSDKLIKDEEILKTLEEPLNTKPVKKKGTTATEQN